MRFGSRNPQLAAEKADKMLADRTLSQNFVKQRKEFAGLNDPPEPEEETWVTTYMDLLTLLLVLFVVLLANADFSGTPAEREVISQKSALLQAFGLDPETATESELTTLGNRLTGEFNEAGFGDLVDITTTPGTLNIRLNDQILFRSGEAHFADEQAAELMKPVVAVLQRGGHSISVEGHTDTVPISTERFPSNWELSAARASFVVRYLISEGVAPERLRAVGFADSQPLASNDSEEGRRQNRRVTLVLSVADES